MQTRLTKISPAGQVAISFEPLGLAFGRGGGDLLVSAAPAVLARVLGVDYPLTARPTAGEAPDATTLELTLEGRAATATLAVVATPGGFRLTLNAPVGAGAVGLHFCCVPGAPWYGGGERVVQTWPLDRGPVRGEPFIPYDFGADGTLNIATPLWFGAGDGDGAVGLLAASNGELDMSLDRDGDGLLRLWARPPLPREVPAIGAEPVRVGPQLTVDVFLAADIPGAYRAALGELGYPASTPPAILFEQPIWTTWARYKMGIDQATTLAFAADIAAHGFGRSVLEIDDRWQATYGELRFDPAKFPDPAALVATLHGLGFAVTLWTPTFFSPASPAFAEAAEGGYLVRHPGDDRPYLVRWWQGYGGLLDVSNPAALDWWLAGLRRLQSDYGIDGYKFDAGEGNFLPPDAVTHAPLRRSDYPDRYVAFVGKHFPLSEVRTGWRSQRVPVFFREWDKASHWGLDNGLHACLTQALALGLAGYPFILPDMIGGNAYDNQTASKELLVRWTQLNALLPAMQFSLPPWDYDAETVALCRRYTELHTQFAPLLLDLARQATVDGTPIIRPLFWHFPADRPSYFVDDAFLLGDRFLVAPVVQPGATARAVYLPPGSWRDYWTGTVYPGGLLAAYPAPLDTLPLFERVDDGA